MPRRLGAHMTQAERRLWYFLRAHRLRGTKFKRQAMIGKYIVDFVCFEKSLVIEVDGGQHTDNETDRVRTRWLEDQGFRVLRFWNNDVLKNTSGVLDVIMTAIEQPGYPSPGTPHRGVPPSPTRGEGMTD
jgi:very-short-patch-repair endonuclease